MAADDFIAFELAAFNAENSSPWQEMDEFQQELSMRSDACNPRVEGTKSGVRVSIDELMPESLTRIEE